MPWSVGDVDKHKKGLSDSQKQQWVRIANSALRKCMADGGSESSCAASAIRQANGVVGHSELLDSFYSSYRRRQEGSYQVEHRDHQGTSYLVVPVIMMVEGVHNGSHGPMLHTIEELGRFPASWNGIPVVIDHPEIDGAAISANEPDVIDSRLVGRVYNTRVDGSRLAAQVWLEEERLRQLSSVVLAQIEAGEPIEVSLGMFTEELVTEGTWNDEQYEAIARNHRPDHLALLPGGQGACSIADGCGIRANKKGGNDEVDEKEFNKALKLHYATSLSLISNEQGYRELVDALRQKLDSMDSENSIYFLQEVYDNAVVYEVRMRIGGSRMYKQQYSYENGVVELTGDPKEVRRNIEYVELAEGSGMVRTKFNNNKKEKEMADNAEKCTPCIKAKVDALIALAESKYEEKDREWLELLTEDQLDKMAPVTITKETVKEVEVLSAEDKAVLEEAKALKKAKRDANIAEIQENSDWTPEELNAMNDGTLAKLAGMARKKEEVVDYSAFGGSGFRSYEGSDDMEPLPPTGIEFKEA